ncbi:MAG: bifunctional phosphoglucose/phosphomannose isomerase [Chloroflexota bacterium]
MNNVDLDDRSTYSRLDPDDMFRRVNDLPEQVESAWQIANRLTLPDEYRSVRSVIITGMGGSAIGGSLLEAYSASSSAIPVQVWRNYGLPAYAGAETLVIAVSYSGGTEETLSALEEAHIRGAKLLVVTTGGRAGELAASWNVPVVEFQYDAQPRAALGYLFTPLLATFQELGLVPDQTENVHQALEIARQCRAEWGAGQPEATNEAKRLARLCYSKEIVIYGAGYLAPVARRWKTQFNENAKNWAFWEEFSELNHNAIVGYEFPSAIAKEVQVVTLKGRDLSSRIAKRMEVTESLLREYEVSHYNVEARGTGILGQMISLIALGDYVSYYAALLNGADPTTIRPINILKEALAAV